MFRTKSFPLEMTLAIIDKLDLRSQATLARVDKFFNHTLKNEGTTLSIASKANFFRTKVEKNKEKISFIEHTELAKVEDGGLNSWYCAALASVLATMGGIGITQDQSGIIQVALFIAGINVTFFCGEKGSEMRDRHLKELEELKTENKAILDAMDLPRLAPALR